MDIHLDLMCNFSLLIFLQKSFILAGSWCVSGITFFQGAWRGQKEKKYWTTNVTSENKRFINKDVLSDTCKVVKTVKRANGLAFTASTGFCQVCGAERRVFLSEKHLWNVKKISQFYKSPVRAERYVQTFVAWKQINGSVRRVKSTLKGFSVFTEWLSKWTYFTQSQKHSTIKHVFVCQYPLQNNQFKGGNLRPFI